MPATPAPAPKQLHDLGQSLWLDNITRGLLTSGTLQKYITEYSVTGLTSNPTIFDNAIKKTNFYDDILREGAGKNSPEDTFFDLAIDDLQKAADLFTPIFKSSDGLDGFVSLEVSPLLAYDTAATIAAAKKLHAKANRPNLYIKIPGTPEGLPAIEEAIFAGIPINVTLLFSTEHYIAAAQAWARGIDRRIAAGLPPHVNSVASLFVSRWDKAVAKKVPDSLKNKLGIAISQQAYKAYRDLIASPQWQKFIKLGVKPQRLLWASTGVKDPAAPDTLYIEALAAADTVNTMPEETLLAFANHGKVSGQLKAADATQGEATLKQFKDAGIDLTAVAAQLQKEGADSFNESWADLIKVVKEKSSALQTA